MLVTKIEHETRFEGVPLHILKNIKFNDIQRIFFEHPFKENAFLLLEIEGIYSTWLIAYDGQFYDDWSYYIKRLEKKGLYRDALNEKVALRDVKYLYSLAK